MGQSLVKFAATAQFVVAFGSIELTPGILHSAVLYSESNLLEPTEAFAEIAISTTLDKLDQRSATLASGNLGGYKTLFWNGNLPIFTSNFLVASVQSKDSSGFVMQIMYTPSVSSRSLNAIKQ